MNKRGGMGSFGVGLMLSIIFFISVVVFIEPIKDQIEFARNADNLDCANVSITTGNQLTCIVVDSYLPGVIGTGVMVSLGLIGFVKLKEEG